MELEETVRAAFAHYDHDSSGSIDVRELQRLVSDLGGIMTEYDVHDALRVLDSDGNGVIDQHEFVAWWSSQKEGASNGVEGMLAQLKEIGRQRFHVDIHTAVWGGADEVVERLIDANEELVNEKDSTDYGDMNTPLHYAAYQGRLAVCSLLTSKGAKVNSTNKTGCTPLFYAAQQSHPDVVKFLLEHGADARMTENQHELSAVDVATSPAIVELFQTLADKAPAPPGRPIAQAISSTELQVKWTAPPLRIDDKLPISSYQLKVLTGSASPIVLKTLTGETEANVGALDADTKYSVMVAAVNLSGIGDFSEPSEPVKTLRASMSTPDLKAARVSEDSVELEWKGDLKTTSWIVYQSTTASNRLWTPVYQCDGDTTSTLVSGLEPGKAYYFRVKAVGSEGNYAVSQSMSVLTNRRILKLFRASLATTTSKSESNKNMPQINDEKSCSNEKETAETTILETELEVYEQANDGEKATPSDTVLNMDAEFKPIRSILRSRQFENGGIGDVDEDEYVYYDSSGSDEK